MTALTHYDTLGVKPDASADEIKRAYRRLAAKTHPDVGGDVMAPLFMAVQAAYEVLGNKARRDSYDYSLGRVAAGPPAGTSATKHSPEPSAHPEPPVSENRQETPAPPRSAATSESTIKARVPASFWLLLTLWACILPVLIGSEEPAGLLAESGTTLPAGAGTLIYAGLWLAGLLYGLTGKTGKGTLLPLVAFTAGVGTAWGLHGGAELPVTLHAAAGLGFTAAASSFARRKRNLARMGITSKGVPRTLTFNGALSAEAAAAQRRTYKSFGALLTQPGTRVLESPCIDGRVLQFLIVNGRRAAIVDSRTIPGWMSPDGHVVGDLAATGDRLRSALCKDMATLSWVPSSDRAGWVAVHPAASGSVRLLDADGSRVSACATATGAEELYQWFADGSRYGVVDPRFLYRLVHEGSSALRHYRHA